MSVPALTASGGKWLGTLPRYLLSSLMQHGRPHFPLIPAAALLSNTSACGSVYGTGNFQLTGLLPVWPWLMGQNEVSEAFQAAAAQLLSALSSAVGLVFSWVRPNVKLKRCRCFCFDPGKIRANPRSCSDIFTILMLFFSQILLK